MKNYRYFLFDLDGTLVDSSPSVYASVRNLERIMGLPPVPQEQLHYFVGPPLAESFRRFYGVQGGRVDELLAVYRQDYRTVTVNLTTVYPGVPELLTRIKEQGCKAGVATLKNPDAARLTLELAGLEPWLDCVAALADGTGHTKSQLIGQCLEQLGSPPLSQVVFFGDSPYDGVGAREAGVDFVALSYGFGFVEPGSMEGLNPVLVAKEPLELLAFVQQSLA